MKPRRVTVTLEIETDAPTRELKSRALWESKVWDPTVWRAFAVQQVQVNVMQARTDK